MPHFRSRTLLTPPSPDKSQRQPDRPSPVFFRGNGIDSEKECAPFANLLCRSTIRNRDNVILFLRENIYPCRNKEYTRTRKDGLSIFFTIRNFLYLKSLLPRETAARATAIENPVFFDSAQFHPRLRLFEAYLRLSCFLNSSSASLEQLLNPLTLCSCRNMPLLRL